MDKTRLNFLKEISFLGFILLMIGNTLSFGNLLIYMLYRPIEKQYFPAILKNKFYKSFDDSQKQDLAEITEPLLNYTN